MQVSNGEDGDFVLLDDVNQSIRESPQPKPPQVGAEWMPRVPMRFRAFHISSMNRRSRPGACAAYMRPPLQFGGSRSQQPDIHGRVACFANVSSKSSASSSPRR